MAKIIVDMKRRYVLDDDDDEAALFVAVLEDAGRPRRCWVLLFVEAAGMVNGRSVHDGGGVVVLLVVLGSAFVTERRFFELALHTLLATSR